MFKYTVINNTFCLMSGRIKPIKLNLKAMKGLEECADGFYNVKRSLLMFVGDSFYSADDYSDNKYNLLTEKQEEAQKKEEVIQEPVQKKQEEVKELESEKVEVEKVEEVDLTIKKSTRKRKKK